MGSLKPGANYIYERDGEAVYAREFGETDRTLIGYDYKPDPRTADGRPLIDHIREDQLWGEIRQMAHTHEGLREELERVIIYYQLLKESDNTVMYHPV
jgi:hypothetical protein